jgi:hypothetical protein
VGWDVESQEGIDVVNNEGLAPSSVGAGNQPAQVIGPDAAFDARWAAWVARGRVHERLVRRKFVVWAGVLATAAAVAYAFFSA